MKRKGLAGAALEKAFASRLEGLLRGVDWLHGWRVEHHPAISHKGFDFLVKLPRPGGGRAELWVQCKADPRPSQFPYTHLASQAKLPPVPVLTAPFISPRMAEVCRENGWSWFDLAGNHWLDVPGLFRLERTGNQPIQARPRPSANLSTPETGRIIRWLLFPAHAGMRWTQGEIRSRCQPQVSLGLVNKVIRHLRDEAFFEVGTRGGFRLRHPLKLLFAWRDAYRFDRHERRGYFTLLQDRKLHDALARFGSQNGAAVAYAAFSAVESQALRVRQLKTWLYVREADLSKFEESMQARPVESGENLVVLVPDDDGVFFPGGSDEIGDGRLASTNAVQTYMDLYHCGGLGQEAAEALLEQRLKPGWRRSGLDV